MMTNNKDVELQVLPDLEQHVVIDDPMSSTVASIVIILLQGPPQDLKDTGQLEQLESRQIIEQITTLPRTVSSNSLHDH